jgi:hydrogenase maturation protease
VSDRTAVVVGLGQPMAGDDGVGIAVARRLADQGIAVRMAADASPLLWLLEDGARLIVVDAVIGAGRPGDVVQLDGRLVADCAAPVAPVSSHGLGLAQAIGLARALHGEDAAAAVTVVGVVIERPTELRTELSPAVAAAVEPAAALIRELLLGLASARDRRGESMQLVSSQVPRGQG